MPCALFHKGGKWKKLQTLGQSFSDTLNARDSELKGKDNWEMIVEKQPGAWSDGEAT